MCLIVSNNLIIKASKIKCTEITSLNEEIIFQQ